MKVAPMDNGQNESDSGQQQCEKFHVVTIPAHGIPECITYDTEAQLTEALRAIHGKRVSCYVFEGKRWHISLPPRKLLNSEGQVMADLSPDISGPAPDLSGLMFDDIEVNDDDDGYFNS
jgi:hypothetical protein